LLLWDLRYSVVLASHRFSFPAKLSTSKGNVSLGLIQASNTLALLSVSSALVNKSPKSSSAFLAIPVTAPATSTIANAMGRASSSAQWLAKSEALPNGHVPHASFDPDHRDLLDKLKVALRQNQPEAADSAFSEWLEKRSSSSATVNTQHIEQGDLLFGHEFVREVLNIVLQSPLKSAATLYPAKTVYHLLENRVVAASMLSQSLLQLLVERKDWVSVLIHPSI
jgi:Utp8 family